MARRLAFLVRQNKIDSRLPAIKLFFVFPGAAVKFRQDVA